MTSLVTVVQILTSILLVITILLQQRGGGLSPVFGGDSGGYRTRRGLEKGIFVGTIILSGIFLVTALLNIILR